MILLQLMWTFFKIGMFSFGGGYAMIPLIQKEIEVNGWVQAQEFADIVAISQMTPGPLAVNASTYIGYKVAGVIGSVFATLGVSLPSFILITIIARFVAKFKESAALEAVLKGIRPVTIGLISSAVIFFAEMSILNDEIPFEKLTGIFAGNFANPFEGLYIVPGAAVICVIVFAAIKWLKINPILAIIISGGLGILIL